MKIIIAKIGLNVIINKLNNKASVIPRIIPRIVFSIILLIYSSINLIDTTRRCSLQLALQINLVVVQC